MEAKIQAVGRQPAQVDEVLGFMELDFAQKQRAGIHRGLHVEIEIVDSQLRWETVPGPLRA